MLGIESPRDIGLDIADDQKVYKRFQAGLMIASLLVGSKGLGASSFGLWKR